MTPEAWAVNIGAILAACTAAGVGAWCKHALGRVETKVDDAATAATQAADAVKPVSNGFARDTSAALSEITELVREVRVEQGRLAERLGKVEDRQIAHLEDHVRSRP